MKKHVSILSFLYMITSGSFIFFFIVFLFLLLSHPVTMGDLFGSEESGRAYLIIITVSLIFSVFGFIGGFGLRKYKQWARIIILIFGCLYLVAFPFGTALGIYTFWVLRDKKVSRLFTRESGHLVSVEDETDLSSGDTKVEVIQQRMMKHVKILSISHIVFNSLCVLYVLYCFTDSYLNGPEAVNRGNGNIILGRFTQSDVLSFLIGILAVLGAVGLLKLKRWARIVVLVMGFIQLINLPVGTILAIYTMWVLLDKDTRSLFASGGGISDEIKIPGRADE
jgi:hypothetical protein